jgi:hypothetical protein
LGLSGTAEAVFAASSAPAASMLATAVLVRVDVFICLNPPQIVDNEQPGQMPGTRFWRCIVQDVDCSCRSIDASGPLWPAFPAPAISGAKSCRTEPALLTPCPDNAMLRQHEIVACLPLVP